MQINLIPLAIYKLHQHQKNQRMLVFCAYNNKLLDYCVKAGSAA